jgi:hypothetical protein
MPRAVPPSHWFRFATCSALLGGIALLLACQAQPVRVAAPANAFRKGRQLTYQVRQLALGRAHAQVDTVVLTSFGPALQWGVDTFQTAHTTLLIRQTKLGYSYRAHAAPTTFSGVIEHDSLLWSHPPRAGAYARLELSPFPYIQLPVRVGHHWSWRLMVGHQWGNPAWATWRGNMEVTSHYQVVGQQALRTPLGVLPCWVVRAQARCQVGTSSLTLWYHPAYGFVQLDYHTIDRTRFTFKLVGEGMDYPPEPLPLPSYPLSNAK